MIVHSKYLLIFEMAQFIKHYVQFAILFVHTVTSIQVQGKVIFFFSAETVSTFSVQVIGLVH